MPRPILDVGTFNSQEKLAKVFALKIIDLQVLGHLLSSRCERFGDLTAQFPGEFLLILACCSVGLQEELAEEIEVGSVHHDGGVDRHGLDLTVACGEEGADGDGVHDESPDHLGDLDDGDEGCD
eukprot:CAMPEP_0195017260 /NCGR_PEP_ID=MMETSP0326_2-20130528/26738_1 /TAXON_ID=2866 ORGANISM="Crypthecodinium cohnii, Strain Seligo" /NCGR_SAMPLE_ID=MMETSP0326_2 /ASSEMBLY_ACC=CAM_ASM_000348 /LENGTH=123 /DNA_ID=CAMNT_0040033613 /DNA_START=130 /DNA_END=499 /DNA_ORIENTATION=+